MTEGGGRRCVCGHVLAEHDAEPPHACSHNPAVVPTSGQRAAAVDEHGSFCACRRFKGATFEKRRPS